MNPISGETLARLIEGKQHPYLIIDARYNYEFKAGHIKNALNVESP